MAEPGSGRVPERALFVSDLHLSAAAPETAQWFFESLAGCAPGATDLFLLGDLFEVWLGDDAHLDDPLAERLAQHLSALRSRGCRIWVMHGNRDFLLGLAPEELASGSGDSNARPHPARGTKTFPERCGARLLPDPVRLIIQGKAVVLSHGDQLCVDDQAYQAWRLTCRDPDWQRWFLAQPIATRSALAGEARRTSESQKHAYLRTRAQSSSTASEAAVDPMDVHPEAVSALMCGQQADILIHGHTHRPARHVERWQVGNQLRPGLRWVLPDWDHAQGRGGFLELSEGSFKMRPSPPIG